MREGGGDYVCRSGSKWTPFHIKSLYWVVLHFSFDCV